MSAIVEEEATLVGALARERRRLAQEVTRACGCSSREEPEPAPLLPPCRLCLPLPTHRPQVADGKEVEPRQQQRRRIAGSFPCRQGHRHRYRHRHRQGTGAGRRSSAPEAAPEPEPAAEVDEGESRRQGAGKTPLPQRRRAWGRAGHRGRR